MSQNLKEFLLKSAYTLGGLELSNLIGFLHANPTVFGASTIIIVGIASVVEQEFFPASDTNTSTGTPTPPAATS